ncbi:DNA-directed RNA polymerases I and III subunit RPAC2-like isoform X3 [Glycine soja]|uniref:DNA-directed RNA polymerases I and III subunit RPAC2-like isoform X3 n=1 Tax=Glycine soja TaxID=3848 RepID=UPI00103ACF41|nr:DNA-directed RNA polymerases I and III subunit RPAC2-like isoform X3 [Glycine soja]XP_040868786.1 DNA-directed RNA polymerases I and III subunit RPAC2 isoform X3 [Glycine max]
MELGSYSDQSKSTFSLVDEDHTFANSVRFTLNQDPRVTFCGYSIPHPSDNRVNIRVQTTGMCRGSSKRSVERWMPGSDANVPAC